MIEAGALAAGFAVGLLGSVHCVAMCGGIAGALAMSVAPARRGRAGEITRQLLYGLGRVSSYALAGAVAGGVGSAAAAAAGPTGNSLLRALAAALIVAMGASLGGWWNGLAVIERAGALLWRRIAPIARGLRPTTSAGGALLLGMLWGWLPCGLVYSALALAAATGHAGTGGALMIGFGAGTVPAVLATGVAAARVGAVLRASASRQVAAVTVVALGVWTLLGSGLVPLSATRGAHDHCARPPGPAVSSPQAAAPAN